MKELSMEEKVNIYEKIAQGNYKGLNPIYKPMYDVISQIDSISAYNKLFNDEEDKIVFMDTVLSTSKRIIDKWNASYLKFISFVILNERFSNNSINDLLLLTFFPNECFNEENKDDEELYSKYLYIIESLLIYNDLYSASKLKDTNLFSYINDFLEYKIVCQVYSNNELDNNAFIPSIVLYCLKNNISNEEFINMVNRSVDNYEKLLNYLELNDDKKHDYELNQMVITKLVNNGNKKVLR